MIRINYVGLKCGICGSNFKEHDDVVVCPDCGTPMHRDCYKENSGCPNSDKHGDGYISGDFDKIKESAQGKNEKVDSKPSSAQTECPICGENNKSDANFCNFCGARLRLGKRLEKTSQQSPTFIIQDLDPLSGVAPDEEFEEDVTAADLASFVVVNIPYYLNVFNKLKQKINRFNLSAAVFSGVWFLYRKQYKIGSLLFSLNVLLYALRYFFSAKLSMPVMEKLFAAIGETSTSLTSLSMEQYIAMSKAMEKLPLQEQFYFALPSIILILQIVIMVLVGLNANKLYYKHCVKRVQSIKRKAAESATAKEEAIKELNLSGGVNMLVAGAFVMLYMFAFFFS